MNFLNRLSKMHFTSPRLRFAPSHFWLFNASLVINLLSLALPLTMLQVYDRIIAQEGVSTLVVLLTGVAFALLLDGTLRLARAYIVNWAGSVYEHTLSCNILRHVLNVDMNACQNIYTMGENLKRFSLIRKIQEFYNGQVFISMVDVPFVVIFLVLIGYIAGDLVWVPIMLLSFFTVWTIIYGHKLRKVLEKHELIDQDRLSFLVETLEGVHSVKGLGLENAFIRKQEDIQYGCSLNSYEVAKERAFNESFSTIFGQVMTVSIVMVGAPMVLNGDITLGALIACVFLTGRIMQPIQKIYQIWEKYQIFIIARDKIVDTFRTLPMERIEPEEEGLNTGTLEVRNLTFRYKDMAEPLFNNVNLRLNKGDVISISGDHSCGKTTLLQLICGLYQPQDGQVHLNGHVSTMYPARYLRQQVAFLETEGVIFRGTIRENLTAFGEVDEANALEIAKWLGLDKEIAKLPGGMETELAGMQGDSVPPGIKQRIAICRALAPKPRVILFDNADRALDKDGYNALYRLLGKLQGKATMILVSDDYNILRLAQQEYVLADGVLTERAYSDTSKVYDVKPYQQLRF